ncbi:MAG: YitT family protein [Bacilli bacterium]|nr:YitT family protein [Bacilli bacterium]
MKLFNHKPLIDNKVLLKEIQESKRIKRAVLFIIGIMLSAISFNLFIKPSHLIFGVSGISIVTEKLFNLDPSIVILIGNIILLIACYTFLGKEKTKVSIIGSLLYPLCVKITEFLPQYIDLSGTEPIVIALCGATISGLGTGIVFKNNYNSGGTDILKQIFAKYGKMPYSKANIYSEGLIMFLGGIVFGWQAFIYSLITLVTSGKISDKVIMGISEYKTLQIVTSKENEIKEFITKNLNHGITEIDAKGGYTNEKKKILLCAIPTREYFLTTEGIKKLDPEAFVIAIDTYEIQGR